MNNRIRNNLKDMDADKARIILELWAEKQDIQNMVWGGSEWRGLRPTFAEELEVISVLIGRLAADARRYQNLKKALYKSYVNSVIEPSNPVVVAGAQIRMVCPNICPAETEFDEATYKL